MLRKATGIAGAIAAGAILTTTALATGVGVSAYHAASANSIAQTHSQSQMINRGNKGDRQPAVSAAQDPRRITTVEVIGLEDAAVVYRDRDGQVLFKTDPVSNVTVVTKNVVLPEVTIRQTADTEVKRLPLESTRPVLSPTSPGTGCESSVTAHTAPAHIARVPSRCITQLGGSMNVASLN